MVFVLTIKHWSVGVHLAVSDGNSMSVSMAGNMTVAMVTYGLDVWVAMGMVIETPVIKFTQI